MTFAIRHACHLREGSVYTPLADGLRFTCNAGKCSKAGDVGAMCAVSSDCLTGFCVDGVCCDTQCAGACKACSAAKKGYGKDGACADVKLGTDPDDDCPTDPPSSCKNTGQCDGSGGCERYGSNTVCGMPSCQSGVIGDNYICRSHF